MKNDKPAIVKGLLWGTFSGTATVSAFVLPAFIIGHLFHQSYTTQLPPYLFYGGITIIFFCAAYHALYRAIASNHDLKLLSTLAKCIGAFIILTILFLFIS